MLIIQKLHAAVLTHGKRRHNVAILVVVGVWIRVTRESGCKTYVSDIQKEGVYVQYITLLPVDGNFSGLKHRKTDESTRCIV